MEKSGITFKADGTVELKGVNPTNIIILKDEDKKVTSEGVVYWDFIYEIE